MNVIGQDEDEYIPKKKGDKRMSVERIYQKKSQLEHILLRPDSYIGSVEPSQEKMWIYDEDIDAIINKTITFTPGLYKIFDEILGMILPILDPDFSQDGSLVIVPVWVSVCVCQGMRSQ